MVGAIVSLLVGATDTDRGLPGRGAFAGTKLINLCEHRTVLEVVHILITHQDDAATVLCCQPFSTGTLDVDYTKYFRKNITALPLC